MNSITVEQFVALALCCMLIPFGLGFVGFVVYLMVSDGGNRL